MVTVKGVGDDFTTATTRSPQWRSFHLKARHRASANVSPFSGLWPFWLNKREQCVPGIASVRGGEVDQTTRELEYERDRGEGEGRETAAFKNGVFDGKWLILWKREASSSTFKRTVRDLRAASVLQIIESNASEGKGAGFTENTSAAPSYFDASTQG